MSDLLSAIDELWWPEGHFKKEQRRFFIDLLEKEKPTNCLEIGFAGGRSCVTTMLSSKPKKMVSVDANLDYADGRGMSKILTARFPRLKIIEGRSQDVLCESFFEFEFSGEGVDFIFVDGCHRYEIAKRDCEICWNALNPGGVMIVDDFESGPPEGWSLPDVKRAVEDFAKSRGLEFETWNHQGQGMAIFRKRRSLLRWTIGDVSPYGFETLAASISRAKSIYGKKFDYVVCHNCLSGEQLSKLQGMNVDLYEQKRDCCSLAVNPGRTNSWKLFPPRLRRDAHEIFMDNDVILHKKIKEIDDFIKLNKTLALQGGRSSGGYGRFESMVPEGLVVCSAVFGYPPNFDAEARFSKLLKDRIVPGQFDEQGMVASVYASSEGILIPHKKIANCWSDYRDGEFGFHFAGVNYGNSKPWKTYKMKMGMYI